MRLHGHEYPGYEVHDCDHMPDMAFTWNTEIWLSISIVLTHHKYKYPGYRLPQHSFCVAICNVENTSDFPCLT